MRKYNIRVSPVIRVYDSFIIIIIVSIFVKLGISYLHFNCYSLSWFQAILLVNLSTAWVLRPIPQFQSFHSIVCLSFSIFEMGLLYGPRANLKQ